MLEEGDVLKTWALEEEPRLGCQMGAVLLSDHRKAYLDYEGPVSGNRGHVARWDHGTYVPLAVSKNEWRIRLAGEKLRGTLLCRSCQNDPGRWIVTITSEDDERGTSSR